MAIWNSEGRTITSPRWVMPIQHGIPEENFATRKAAASQAAAERAAVERAAAERAAAERAAVARLAAAKVAAEHCVAVDPLTAAPYAGRRSTRRGYAVPSRVRFANRVPEPVHTAELDQDPLRRQSVDAFIRVCQCQIR